MIEFRDKTSYKGKYHKYGYFKIPILSWLVLLVCFFLIKSVTTPKYFIYSKIDDYIPYIKWFIIPYTMWYFYLFVGLLYIGLKSKNDLFRLQTYIFSGMSICFLIYIFFPNGISFKPDIVQNDFLSSMVKFLYSIDAPTCVLPSIHVFDAIAVHVGIVHCSALKDKKALVWISFIIMIFICASTVFIKQHSFIDIICGIILAAVLYYPIYGFSKRQITFPVK